MPDLTSVPFLSLPENSLPEEKNFTWKIAYNKKIRVAVYTPLPLFFISPVPKIRYLSYSF